VKNYERKKYYFCSSWTYYFFGILLNCPYSWVCRDEEEYSQTESYIMNRTIKNGKLEGISKGYDESGKLSWEWNYKNGEREGIARNTMKTGK